MYQCAAIALQVERCILVSKNGMHSDLEPTPDGAATVVPTFAPAQHERALNTRSASAAHDRRARTMQVACQLTSIRLHFSSQMPWSCSPSLHRRSEHEST